MEELIKKQTVEKFLSNIKSGVCDISISNSVVDSLVSSFSELQNIANREMIINATTGGIINDKSSYLNIIPLSYQEKYSYEEGLGSYPWLWLNFTKTPEDAKIQVQIEKDGVLCEFGDSVSKIGTISEDKKTLSTEAKNYIGLELVKDLGLTGNLFGTYHIIFRNENGDDEQIFEVVFM